MQCLNKINTVSNKRESASHAILLCYFEMVLFSYSASTKFFHVRRVKVILTHKRGNSFRLLCQIETDITMVLSINNSQIWEDIQLNMFGGSNIRFPLVTNHWGANKSTCQDPITFGDSTFYLQFVGIFPLQNVHQYNGRSTYTTETTYPKPECHSAISRYVLLGSSPGTVKAGRDPDRDGDGDRRGGVRRRGGERGWATGCGEGVDEVDRAVEAGGEEQDRGGDSRRGQLRRGGGRREGLHEPRRRHGHGDAEECEAEGARPRGW